MSKALDKLRNNMAAGSDAAPRCDLIDPTPEQKVMFLTKVAEGASMRVACRELGLPYAAITRALVVDADFAEQLQMAIKVLRPQALEEIAIELATVGIDKPLTYQGHVTMVEDELTGEKVPHTVKELVTSHSLLLALLKANAPDKFGDRSEIIHRPGDKLPERITNQSDREKILAHLQKLAKSRAESEDDLL